MYLWEYPRKDLEEDPKCLHLPWYPSQQERTLQRWRRNRTSHHLFPENQNSTYPKDLHSRHRRKYNQYKMTESYLCSSAKRELSFRNIRVCIQALVFDNFLVVRISDCSDILVITWDRDTINSRASRSNTTYSTTRQEDRSVTWWPNPHRTMPSQEVP